MTTKKEFTISPNSSFNFRYIEMAAKLKAAGFSNADIAYTFGMNPGTIQTWIKKHPGFARAIKEGKGVAASYVVSKAFKSACGYEYEEENIKYDKDGEVVGRSVFKKHQAPNPKLIMWLLCNLEPDTWKSEHKILVEQDKHITIKLDGNMASKQIERLAGKLLDPPKRKIIEVTEVIPEVEDGNN